MNTQPIPPTTLLDDLKPARFIQVEDLLNRWKMQSITVTVKRLAFEETIPNPNDVDPATRKPRIIIQPVLYFQTKTGDEFPRGYLLSAKADIESLKTSTLGQTVGEVTGKKIKIVVGEHKRKAVLRIDPHPVKE